MVGWMGKNLACHWVSMMAASMGQKWGPHLAVKKAHLKVHSMAGPTAGTMAAKYGRHNEMLMMKSLKILGNNVKEP